MWELGWSMPNIPQAMCAERGSKREPRWFKYTKVTRKKAQPTRTRGVELAGCAHACSRFWPSRGVESYRGVKNDVIIVGDTCMHFKELRHKHC